MNLEEYLNRINYTGTLTPSFEVLKALQEQHLLNVPFENLDIHYGRPIVVEVERFYQKVVLEKRGGFCYELNGLFYSLLTHLGFKAKMISCRVFNPKTGYGQEFDHLAIIVDINSQEYLVDVGFGEFTFAPLSLTLNLPQVDPRGQFILEKQEDDIIRVSRLTEENSTPEYIFTETERALSDFQGMCHYHQTHPDSHFTNNRLITRPTRNGRITLSGDRLKIKNENQVTEEELKDEVAFADALFQYFKINIEKQTP